jgi:hypothetical protein
MKNQFNRGILLVALVIVVAWMTMKFMEGRRFSEKYEITKDDIIKYVKEEAIDPVELMSRVSQVTDDEEIVEGVYMVAEEGTRDDILEFLERL